MNFQLKCERILFITPSIQQLLSNENLKHFCVSEIRETRPFLKSCYISFQNLKIEILEVSDLALAENFVFYEKAKILKSPEWVAIGLCTNNLDYFIEMARRSSIEIDEFFSSGSSNEIYKYKHKSALLRLKWFDRLIYVTEYDPSFYAFRENGIVKDFDKMNRFSVPFNNDLNSLYDIPNFLTIEGGYPKIQVVDNFIKNSNSINALQIHQPHDEKNSILDFEWLKLVF